MPLGALTVPSTCTVATTKPALPGGKGGPPVLCSLTSGTNGSRFPTSEIWGLALALASAAGVAAGAAAGAALALWPVFFAGLACAPAPGTRQKVNARAVKSLIDVLASLIVFALSLHRRCSRRCSCGCRCICRFGKERSDGHNTRYRSSRYHAKVGSARLVGDAGQLQITHIDDPRQSAQL